jgi:hypothetical protein
VLIQLPIVFQLLTSGWVLLLFILLFGLLPLVAFPQKSIPSLSSRIVGAFVRTAIAIACGSILWAKLGLFTWLTAVLVYLAGLGIGWFGSHQWQLQATFQQLGQQIAIATVDIFDRGLSLGQIGRWLLLPWKSIYQPFIEVSPLEIDRQNRLVISPTSKQMEIDGSQRRSNRTIAATAAIHYRSKWSPPLILLTAISTIAILGLTIRLRFEHPLTEFRFSHPDTYGQLFITQQILARDVPQVNYLPVFPSVTAFLTALSGVHPLQVIHLLGAIFGTLLVLSIGYTIRNSTKNGAAALAATYSLGAYLFTWNLPISGWLPIGIQQWLSIVKDNLNGGLIRSWAVSDLEVGAIFVILALGCSTHLFRSSERTAAGINTICCVLLVAAIAPSLLILVFFAGFGLIFGRRMALFTLSTSWVLLGLLVAIPESNFPLLTGVFATLPIGLSLFVGMLFVAISSAGRLLLANWSAPVCLTIFLAITLNFCLPSVPQINYLEYDAAARKAIEIGHLLPRHTWTIVAPIDQLAQVYGHGWYQDLAEFVTKYQDRVADPNFHFPSQTSLSVFAEKVPFTTDKPEFPVPYSVLVDPTYRHYRSPSGRAQLAQATLKLCETYRQHHPDSQIYYEDEHLRIYQFSPLK